MKRETRRTKGGTRRPDPASALVNQLMANPRFRDAVWNDTLINRERILQNG